MTGSNGYRFQIGSFPTPRPHDAAAPFPLNSHPSTESA